jgi:hypothetical protein
MQCVEAIPILQAILKPMQILVAILSFSFFGMVVTTAVLIGVARFFRRSASTIADDDDEDLYPEFLSIAQGLETIA